MKLVAAAVSLLAVPLGTWAQQQKPVPKIEHALEGHVIIRKLEKPWLPVPGKVYRWVEQMPELPSGSGIWRIVAEIVKRANLPADSLKTGRTLAFVYFEVSSAGAVQHACMEKTSGSSVLDANVLRAVQALPKFRPGLQAGRPATVSFIMPIRQVAR